MAGVTISFQTDAALKAQFEAVLSGLGLTLDSAFNHYMKELVQDYEEVDIPPSPYLSTPETLADDLREAEEARLNGVPFVPAEEVLAKMERTIREVKERGA